MENSGTRWVLGHQVRPVSVSGDYDMILGTTPGKVQGPPPHYHSNYNELFLVTEGQLEFVVDGELRIVGPGETVDLPPGTMHTFTNNSDQPCSWVNVHSPKGFMEFFDEVGVAATEEQARERSLAPELIQKVIATAASFDMHIQMEKAT